MLPRPIRQTELQPTSRGWLTLARARRATRPLILLALLFLSLLGCGQLALWVNAPTVTADTRSQLAADYGPWSFTIIHPVDPAIIEEILRDEGAASTGPLVVEAAGFWPTLTAPTRETVFDPATQTPPPAAPATSVAFIIPTNTPPPPATTAGPALSPTGATMAFPTSTATPLPTRAATRTRAPAPAMTATWTSAPILAPTSTQTSAPAPTNTSAPPPSPTNTPSPVNTATPAATATRTATLTSTATGTAAATTTPVATATPTASNTPVSTPTPSDTPTTTPTSSDTPTPTFTPIPTSTATATDTPTITPTPCTGSIPPGEPDVIPPSAPNGQLAAIACGTAIVIDLGSNPIVITGSMDPDYDLVYYERDSIGGILLDWVIVDVCTDSSCTSAFTVFYWGNAAADTNTNIGVAGYGPPEADNQPIPYADLWGSPPYQTGIAIDVDMAAPAGTYQWVRIYAPPDGANDPSEVDAVEVLP